MADTHWQLRRPPVSVDMARRIHHVSYEMTKLKLDVLGHGELYGCLRAAAAAVDECTRIVDRDVDRGKPRHPKKKAGRKP